MAQLNDGRVDIVSRDDGKILSQANAGTSHNVLLNQPSIVKVHGTREMVAEFERQGNDLILHMRDGSVVRYQQFFFDDIDGDHSELVFDDGVNPAEHALFPVTTEFADAQTAMAIAPEYESLGSLEPLLLADIGASSGVMTAAGIGALGLAGLTVGALAGGGGGGGGGDDGGNGGGTTPLAPTVSVNAFTGDDVLTQAEKGSNQTLNGTTTNAEAGSILTLILNGKTYTTTVGADGSWSISIPAADLAALPDGNNTLRVSVTNSDGNTATSNEVISVQADAAQPGTPAITIGTFAGDNVLDGAEKQNPLTLSGTTTNVQQGQTVTVTLGGQTYTASVAANGSWRITVPASALQGLEEGTNTITARVSNAAGTAASATHAFDVQPATVSSISISPISGDGQLNAAESQTSLTISGFATGVPAGTLISVTLGGKAYSATVGANGSWTATVPAADLQQLPQGSNLVTAIATLADGTLVQNSSAVALNVHTTAPNATLDVPFGDGVLSGNEASSGQTLTGNTGATGAGQTVTVTVGGTEYTGTVNADGSWSVTLPPAGLQTLPQGSNDITVVVTDPAGNSATSTTPVNVITAAPPLTVTLSDNLLGQNDVNDPLTVSGTSNGSQTIIVTLNGVTYTTTVNANGSWSVNVPASDLQQITDGNYAVTVTSTDALGNSTTSSDTQLAVDITAPGVTVETVSGNGYVDASEKGSPVGFAGQTEAGSTVIVRLDTLDPMQSINLPATVDPVTGRWTATLSGDQLAALTDGSYTVTVIATDPAGNSSQDYTNVTFITEPANLPAISVDPLTGDGVLSGAEVAQNQVLSGTTERVQAGSVVTLTLADNSTYTGVVQPGGDWSIELPTSVLSGLQNGTQSFTVVVQDVAGNSGQASGTFTVDVVADAGSLNINPVSGDNALNALEAQSDLVINGTSLGVTAATPLTVTFNGVTYNTTVGTDGAWSVTVPATALAALENNGYTVTVSTTDADGNPVTSASNLEVRTSFPNNIVVDVPFGDNILNSDETQLPQTLSGNTGVAYPDQVVTVTIGGVDYNVPVNTSSGAWSLTLLPEQLQALQAGASTVTVTVSDSLGNSVTSSSPFVVDTTAPGLTVSTVGDNNGVVNGDSQNQPLIVSGTAEANSTIRLELNGVTVLTAADADGNWSATVSPAVLQTLPDGKYDLSVTATDAGGNQATTLTPLFKDTIAPDVTLSLVSGDGYLNAVEHGAALTLTGTAELGSSVVVTLNGAGYPTTVDANGNWSVTVPAGAVTALADGTYPVSVQATDAAGNNGTTTQSLVVIASAAELPTVSVAPFTGDGILDGAEKGLSQLMTGTTTNVQAGQLVTVTLNGEQYTGAVQADGSWSVLVPATAFYQLANGTQNYSVEVSDAAGNPASATGNYTVNGDFSAIAIGIISDDNMLNTVEAQNDLVINGSSRFVAFGARILVRFNNASYETTTNTDGSWSVTVPAAAVSNVQNGDITVTATATDRDGNVITTTHSLTATVDPNFTVSVDTPFVDGTLNGAESLTDGTLTGTTGVDGLGQSVTLVLSGITYTGTVDANGNWSVALPNAVLQALPQGSNAYNVTVTDASGNTTSLGSTFTVDTVAPTLSVDAISDDNRLNIAEHGDALTLSGSGGEGDQISLTLNNVTYTATVDAGGSWNIALPAEAVLALNEGLNQVQVVSTDVAGNTTSTVRTLEVDLTPPPVTVDPVSGDGYLNQAEGSQPLVLTGSGDIGNTITVELNDRTYNTTVGADGQWSLTLPADLVVAFANNSVQNFTVTASDAADNRTTIGTQLVVDKTPPSIVVSDITSNNIVDASEQQSEQLISGIATNVEAGQTLTLTVGGVEYTTTILSGGTWQVTVPAQALGSLTDGPQSLTASTTDLAGNSSTTTKNFIVDSTLSSVSIEPISADGYLNAEEAGRDLVVNGFTANVAEGSTVTFTLNTVSYTGLVQADGSWSVIVPVGDVADIGNGRQTATVSVTAESGLTVTNQSTLTVLADPTLAPTLTQPFTDGILTNAEAGVNQTLNGSTGQTGDGQTVTVNIGGEDYTATVNSSGIWSLILTPEILQALPQGNSTVTVNVTDIAGNTAALTPPAGITVASTLPTLTLADVAGGDNIINADEQGGALTLSGTVTPGDTVSVTLNGTSYDANVAGDGSWSLAIPAEEIANLEEGAQALSIVASDAYGNTTTQNVPLSVDTAAPLFTVNPIAGDEIIDRIEQSNPLQITGTGTLGDSVSVTLGGQTYTTTVGTNGEWSVTVPATTLGNLSEGDNTVSVVVTTPAGNSDNSDTTVSLETFIDPTVIVNTVSGDDLINAAEAQQGLTVTGSVAGNDTTVTVNLNGVDYPATVAADGLWSVTIPANVVTALADGNYTLSVTGTPVAGPAVTVQHPVTLDTAAPTLNIAAIAGDGQMNATEQGQPLAVSGTGEVGDSVRVSLNGTTYQTTVDGNGNWSVTVPATDVGGLTNGTYPVNVTVADAAGNTTSRDSTLTVDLTAPALNVNPIAGDGVLNALEQQLPLTVSGTGENGAGITVTFQDTEYSTTVGANGQWTLDIPAEALTALTNGTYALTVVATDPAGNSTTQPGSLTVVADAASLPTLTLDDFAGNNVLDSAEQQVDQLLSGTTSNVQAGQAVTVTLNGVTYTGLVLASGAWSVSVPATALAALADGSQNYSVTVGDTAGNPVTVNGDFTVNTSLSALAVDPVSGDGYLNRAEAGTDLTLSGTSFNVPTGNALTVTLNGVDYAAEVGTDGRWSVSVPSADLLALPDGPLTVTVSGSDAAGNAVASTTGVTVAITDVPAVTADQPFTDGSLNAAEAGVAQTLTGATGVTGDGQAVSVVINGTTYTGTVDGDGNWSVTVPAEVLQALPQGDTTATVNISDAAGNTATGDLTLSVDTLPPAVDVGALAGDNILNAAEQGADLVVAGTGDAPATVVVTLNGQDYTTTVGDNGQWTLTVPQGDLAALTDGSYIVSITSTDAAGNSTSIDRSLAVKADAASLPTLTVDAFAGNDIIDGAEQQTAQILSGSTRNVEAGQTVTVTLNGEVYTAQVQASGAWSVSLPSTALALLTDGPATIAVAVSDAAGNPASASRDVTVNSAASGISLDPLSDDGYLNATEAQDDLIVSGTTANVAPGSPVTVTFNGQTFTAQVGANGVWNAIIPASALAGIPDGTVTLTASVVDNTGATITGRSTLSVHVSDLPLATADTPFTNGVLNGTEVQATQTLSGTTGVTGDGQTVAIVVDGTSYNGTVDANGNWSVELPAAALQTLPQNDSTLPVTVTDAAGNSNTLAIPVSVDTVAPVLTVNPVAGNDVVNTGEAAGEIAVSGSSTGAQEGQLVTVSVNGQSYTTPVDADGNWTLQLPAGLLEQASDGTYPLTVSLSDAAGNTATETVQLTVATAELQPTISTPFGDGYLNSNEAADTQTLSGTTGVVGAGQSVSVNIDGQDYSATVDANGNWTLPVASTTLLALGQGAQALIVTATDAQGNTGEISTTVTVDTVAPTLALSPVAGDNILNATEILQPVSVSGTASVSEAGQPISITFNGQTYQQTVQNDGSWRLDLPASVTQTLADGTYPVTVTLTDSAGNTITDNLAVTVDASPASLPTITIGAVAGDDYINTLESGADVTVSGATTNVTEGQTVTLTLNEVTYTAIVQANGSWSAVVPVADIGALADGAQTLTASVADTSGNPASTTHQVTVIAQAADLPTITISPVTSDDVINYQESQSDLQITGTSQHIAAGDNITVSLNGTAYTATVDANGNWTATVPAAAVQALDQGTNSITASGNDIAGNPASSTESFSVDTNPPILTVTLGAGTDGILNLAEALTGLLVSGTSEANTTVNVTLNDKNYTATVGTDGIWSLTIPSGDLLLLPDGQAQVGVSVTDTAGNTTSDVVNLGVAVNTLPVLTLTTPFVDGLLNAAESTAEQVLSGTATNLTAGTEVVVTVGAVSVTGAVLADGTWSATFPAGSLAGLADGALQVSVTAADEAGNPASVSGSVEVLKNVLLNADIATPFVDGALNAAEAGVDQVIRGTTGVTGAGQTVTLSIDGNEVTTTVATNGNWSATLTPTLAATLGDGTHTIDVTVTDRAGNTSSDSLDFTAIITGLPAPTLVTPFTDGVLNAAEAAVDGALTGATGIIGAQTVSVNVNGTVYQATVNEATGSWSLALPSSLLVTLPDGNWPITVTATDSAGNVGTASGNLLVVVQNLPDVSLVLPFGDAQLNVAEAAVDQLLSGSTGKIGAGQTVAVTISGINGDAALPATVDASGNWSLTLTPTQLQTLANGAHSLSVTATDSAGNSDTVTSSFTAFLTAPDPTIATLFGDGTLNITEAAGALTLTGTTGAVGANQGVQLRIDLAGITYTGTVDATGNWSVVLPAGALSGLASGTHSVNVTVTDPAGNSTTEGLNFTAALSAPVPTLNTPFVDSFLNGVEVAAGAALTGTTGVSGAGQTVRVTVGGTNFDATVATNGNWTLNLTPAQLTDLGEGAKSVSVVASDIAGNSATVGGSFTIDTSVPTVTLQPFTGDNALTYLESLTAQTLSGTTTGAGAGQVVTVTLGTATLTGVVQADGSWTVNVTPAAMTALAVGGSAGIINVSVADVAGNIGTVSANVTLDLTPPATPLLTLAPVSDDNIINSTDGATLTVGGTFANLPGVAGTVTGTVTVSIDGDIVGTYSVVTAEGNWSVSIPNSAVTLADGTHTVTATLAGAGTADLTSSEQIVVDRVVPTLTIDAFAGDNVLNGSEAAVSQTLSGTASLSEVGRAVTVTLEGKTYTGIVQAGGTWSVTVPSGDLQALTSANPTFSASLSDAAGNTGNATLPITVDTAAPLLQVDALLGDNLLNAVDIETTQLLTGRASGAEGQTIGLYLGDGSPIATALVQADGTFSLQLTPEVLGSLTDGTLVFGLRVNDASGNQTDATLTVNKVVNSLLNFTVDSLFGDGFLNAADTAVAQTITGIANSAGIGATVSLTLGGTTLTANVGQDGNFALVVPPNLLGLLQPGDTELNLVLTDAAGNTRTLGETVTTILTNPTIGALTNLFGDNNLLNIAESTVAQTIGGTIDGVTGSTVTVTLGSKSYQTLLQAGGQWNVTIPTLDLAALSQGDLSLGVTVVDPAGNTATTSATVGIFTAQPTISLSSIFGDGILNIADALTNQTISGVVNNVAAGTVIRLNVGSSEVTATVGENGTFSATVTPDILGTLTSGNLTVGASLTDAAGNTASTSLGATVKLTAPSVSVTPLFGDSLLNLADAVLGQTIGGTIANVGAGARVVVTIGTTQFVTTTLADGTFSLALSPAILQGLSDGNLSVGVSVTDSAGNTASTSASALVGLNLPTITLNPVFGDGVLSLLDALVTQTITGTVGGATAAGSSVVISIGNSTVTATVGQNGTFSAQVAPDILGTLLDGNLTVGVQVTDAVGNVSSTSAGVRVGIHTTPTLTLNTVFGDGVLSASDLTTAQTISGGSSNLAAGTTVTVTLNSKTYTTTVGNTGSWSLSVPKADLTALANGSLTVNATATDAYGNAATNSGSLSVIAQTPPTVSISSVFGDGLLSATDALSAQTITGTSTNAEGSTITVRVGTATLTTTVAANGTWTVSVPVTTLAALPDGTDAVSATLTNPAGNAGTANTTVLVGTHTLPTVALTSSTLFGGDHYLNLSEANVAETISGTSTNAVGSTVSVNVAGYIYTTTVGANGAWSVSVPSAALKAINDGSYTVTATVTDAVGNTSAASDTFTAVTHNLPLIGVDPVLSLVSVLLTGLTVSGGTLNLAQGSKLNVTLGGQTQQATTDALGRYSVKFTGGLLTALSLNSIVTVTAVDAAGNPVSTSNTLLLGSLLPVASPAVAAASMLMAVAADDSTAVAAISTNSTTSEENTTAVAHAATVDSTLVVASDTSSTDTGTTAAAATSDDTTATAASTVADDSSYTIGGVVVTLADGQTVEGASVTGSSGNDTVTVNSLNFTHIDGGAGTDTLVLNGEHMTLDLTSLGLKVEHIEIIDLGKAGSNSVKLDLNEALNITDSQANDLLIKGTLGDQITLANSDGGVWATAGQRTVDGQTFDVYHNSALSSGNTLGDVLVQHNLQVHVV